jgi:hypothetical protein
MHEFVSDWDNYIIVQHYNRDAGKGYLRIGFMADA